MVDPVHGHMSGRGLGGRHSQFVFTGATVGLEAPTFAAWRPAF